MSNFINKYQNQTAYDADETKDFPNVSYLVDEEIIKWQISDPIHMVATYNVTSIENPTNICSSFAVYKFTYALIDGVKIDGNPLPQTYQFDTTGIHTIKYKFVYMSDTENSLNNCTDLISVSIPYGIENLQRYAFNGCSKLSKVNLPKSITLLGTDCFRNCISLTSIKIPDSVTTISSAFKDCTALTNVNIPNSVVNLIGTFNNCTALTEITIPDSVTTIGDYTFKKTKLNSVTIPDGVTSIGIEAFYSLTRITSIKIPDSVETIGYNAFRNCSNLAEIIIGTGITSIGGNAFDSISNNSPILIMAATTPPTITNTTLGNSKNTHLTIYVPDASLETYKTATNWNTYASQIKAISEYIPS